MSGPEETRAKTEELLDAMMGEMAKRKTKKLMIGPEQQNGADGRAGGGAGGVGVWQPPDLSLYLAAAIGLPVADGLIDRMRSAQT